jgi:hypothetical protein
MNLLKAGGTAFPSGFQASSRGGMHNTRRRDSLGCNVGSNEPPSHHAQSREPKSNPILDCRLGRIKESRRRTGHMRGQNRSVRKSFVNQPFEPSRALEKGLPSGALALLAAEELVGYVQRRKNREPHGVA